MRWRRWSVVVIGGVALLAAVRWTVGNGTGAGELFPNDAFHFQALRALDKASDHGAEPGEVLEIIRKIPSGDMEAWYAQWYAAAERVRARGDSLTDPHSKAHAYLRAHNYYRTAEFFLAGQDPRRPPCFAASVQTFRSALDLLGVPHEFLDVPYGEHTLRATYYPGPPAAAHRPLIVVGGGFDSTEEELYFMAVTRARERGYNVLTYAGPGQGAVLREEGLPFTHEWEKPVGAVLDAFEAAHGVPDRVVLIGISLGGYLAPRAAAFEPRVDGVVAWDVMRDFYAVGLSNIPSPFRPIIQSDNRSLKNTLARVMMRVDPGVRWGIHNGMWAMGVANPGEVIDAMRPFHLRDVADRITCDVLVTAGEADHFFDPAVQLAEFKRALVNARSVNTILYDRASAGHAHCRVGAISLWEDDCFEWLRRTFPDAPTKPAAPA